MNAITAPQTMLFGIALLLLGLSFGYKTWQAVVLGRVTYWSGFMPISVVSPFFTHLPPGQRGMCKTADGVWVHALMGPVFLILTVLFLIAGADLVGLKGSDTVNRLLNGGGTAEPASIIFDSHTGYRFPIVHKALSKMGSAFGKSIDENENQKLLHDDNRGNSVQDQINRSN